jgi:NADH-quinone oxidoreductase subunit K
MSLPEPTLNSYLMLSAVLFAIGTAGVFLRRNLITILLSIEVMLNAVNLTFVAVDRFRGLIDGQIIVFFVMTVAAAEAAVGPGHRHRALPAQGNTHAGRLHVAQVVTACCI